MKRTLFERTTRLFLAMVLFVSVFGGCAAAPIQSGLPSSVQVTVLFFNDLHGHLQPFEIKAETGKQEVGGIARMATLINQIRAENEAKHVTTLVLVAGDILQGTPMSTVFRGEPDIKCLNAMGVNAVTVGNHEFDFGLENFLMLQRQANFPFLSANIVDKQSGRLLAQASLVVPLSNGLNFTIIGITTRELMTTTKPDNVATLQVLDSVAAVQQVYEEVKGAGPVLLLSHSRHQTDRAMAEVLPDLAAIIGGHDQILLSPYRTVGRVPVFQAFEKGRYLGRIDLQIETKSKQARLLAHTYIPITAQIPADPAIAAIVAEYDARLGAQFKEVIGQSRVFMDGERGHIRYEETALGNFITDIMVENTGAQIGMINSGALRSSIKEGPVTVEDVFKAMPYANELVLVNLTGAEIEQTLARSVQGAREDEDGGFLHVSGLFFDVRGRQVENIRIGAKQTPLNKAGAYQVVVPDFLASGGDGHQIFKDKPQVKTGSPLRELIVETIKQRGTIDAKVEGRIRRIADK
ncbi:MAG: 5'-nucleotidase C-terminal domain-containing protein [Desulfobacteraceae bacterium]|nr:5'-nucleotidase C-terminal domain-containing protein [Desulfobacteraceae bacterium]